MLMYIVMVDKNYMQRKILWEIGLGLMFSDIKLEWHHKNEDR